MGKNKKVFGSEAPIHKEEPVKEVEQVVNEPEVETVKEVEVVEEVEVPGVVDNVQKSLNVRKEPKVEPNNQVGILEKGTKVIVMKPKEPIEANGETWFKISFGEPKQEGYAMKKYIRIL